MLTRLIPVVLAACVLAACGADDSDEGSNGAVAEAVAEQLQYLDPQSVSVVAIDLRWEGDNWDDLRPIVDRLLQAYLKAAPQPFPGSAQGAAEEIAQEIGLKFSDDVEPALDGHLVIGSMPGDGEQIFVYRTQEGDLRKLAEAVSDEEPVRPLKGYDDTVTIGSGFAIVGGKTAVLADGDAALRRALDRAQRDVGFPGERLAEAERDVGMDDPLLLATGDLGSVRSVVAVDDRDFERARESVPYLRALRRGSLGIDVGDDGIEAELRLVTDGEELSETDLPVGPAGELELPSEGEAPVVGANRDQSFTTVFGAKVARALFADSRFVRAVERAEKELGISFDDEVLRQFDCPSVSVLEPPEAPGSLVRFAARSCVNDPDRMRDLLPRLRPYLPAILNGLDGLGTGGLTALLLLAPDAPLVPGAVLGQIHVQPLGDAGEDEQLFEVTAPPGPGPDRMIFGLIGDAFVVATDEEMARRAADLDTDTLDDDAAGAVRVPVTDLLQLEGAEGEAFAEVFEDLVATISAEPGATVATARAELRD